MSLASDEVVGWVALLAGLGGHFFLSLVELRDRGLPPTRANAESEFTSSDVVYERG